MEYVIDTFQPVNLNWSAKGNERIIQNVQNIISTFLYEVAYNRGMGINPQILDKPADVAVNEYVAELYRVVPDYEPRAEVKDVRISGIDDEGNIQFKVVINI